MIKVSVVGAKGRMGSHVVEAVNNAEDTQLALALDAGDDLTQVTTDNTDVVVEFTVPSVSLNNVLTLIGQGVDVVVGTTGWTDEKLAQVKSAIANGPKPETQKVFIAPNFAISAVLADYFATKAAKYFESAEVIELHHPTKVDAPSGTAIHTAHGIAEARKAAQAKAVAERTTIVEKAEALAASLGDNTNWRSTADKFRNLFDEWQNHQRTTVRIDKPEAEALWKRFSAARTTFNQARRKWAQARDNERTAAKEAKEAIIAEANELKDSTAWGETSRKFNDLMDRWKKAGRAGRNEDDELWAKFREAADTFFNARQADRDQINSSEKENLAAKEALLVKAEALVPVKTDAEAKKARQELAKIQEEWDQIGYVPRDDMRRIENRLDAVDKQIKAIEDAAWKQTDPEADARKSSFEEQLNAQLAELDAKIAAESDPKKKAKLEAEKATKEQWLNAIK